MRKQMRWGQCRRRVLEGLEGQCRCMGDRAATGISHILVKTHATNFHHEHEEVWTASPVEQPDNMLMPLHTAQQV